MKHHKRKLPLRFHLAIGFLIFSVLLVAILWIFQTVFLETFYKTIKTHQVRSCADSIAEHIDSAALSPLLTDIEEQNNMSVSIFNTDSNIFSIVYASGENPNARSDLSLSMAHSLYRSAVESGGEYSNITRRGIDSNFEMHAFSERRSTDDEARVEINIREPLFERKSVDSLAFAKVVTVDSSEYLIIVESEITPVTSVVETLRFQLIIVTVILLVLSIVMAIITAYTISKPISDTNEKAKELARRHYDLSFSDTRYREIKELDDTLSYAAHELKKVDDLQKELIANISHDLRTPLTMITGYSEVMRDLPGEVTPENIQIIIDEANRLNSLVTDLLDISRLQSGTADIKRAPFSLTNCVLNIFTRYTKLIENDGLNIVFEHDREVFITGDELRMTQVLYNLINNAINYIGEDKTVIVRQTVSDGMVRIDVIDHGEGIPKEKLDYIWDRYYRVDKEHRRARIGTGLGLSIVKNILIAHDADFGVASKLGKGSDFYFSLPVIEPDPEDGRS